MADLYRMCREKFYASSMEALEATLNELEDHEIVRVRMTHGSKTVGISLGTEALIKLLEDLANDAT